MKKMTAKDYGKITLLGTGVVVLQPIITSAVGDIGFLATELFAGLTIGGILSAGVAAFGVQWAIDQWL